MIKAIFATDLAGGFGLNGGLPWPSIKEDFKHFKDVTMDNYIAMGYNTYKTLPKLKSRTPIVILNPLRDAPDLSTYPALFTWYPELDTELGWLSDMSPSDVILIGGTSLLIPEYLKLCGEIYHTTVKGTYEADTYISDETLPYLSTLNAEIILDTDNCTIRKYTA